MLLLTALEEAIGRGRGALAEPIWELVSAALEVGPGFRAVGVSAEMRPARPGVGAIPPCNSTPATQCQLHSQVLYMKALSWVYPEGQICGEELAAACRDTCQCLEKRHRTGGKA